MRIVAISLVKNEVDIVEPFVRHAVARVDRLIVLDNGSTDGTRQILQHLVNEGLAIDVIDDPEPGFYQARRMTNLMRDHALERCRADWVVPLDADEFLVGPDLKSIVRSIDDRPFGLQWQTYVPDPADRPEELNPVRRIRHRLKQEERLWIKVMVPAVLGRQPGTAFDHGSHQFIRESLPVPPVLGGSSLLAHFPGRSPDQFASKLAMKHMQYLAMTERAAHWGFHYRSPTARLRQGCPNFEAAFRDMILRYNLTDDQPFAPEVVLDPLAYAGGDLRYLHANGESRLLATLWDCAEDFARRHAELSRCQKTAEAAIQALQRSWTWRAGRFVLGPVRWTKRWLGARPVAR